MVQVHMHYVYRYIKYLLGSFPMYSDVLCASGTAYLVPTMRFKRTAG